ncbi:MAG: hypothetical protein R3A44_40545 [Caldilineaceae bacterium]
MSISQERLSELQALQDSGDETIDFSEIPELNDDFWKHAVYRTNPIDRLVKRARSVKVTLSLSEESVEFFKQKANEANIPYQKLIRLAIDDYIAGLT